MLWKRTKDEQLFRDVLAVDKADRKRLEAVQRELDAVRPQWAALQEQAEILAARYAATERVYSRSVHEGWWAEVDSALKAQFEQLVARRDALTMPFVQQIADLRAKIHGRHGILSGAFGSWASVVANQLPAPLDAEIVAARREIEQSQDLAAIFKSFEQWITRVGDLDELPTTIPVPNLGHVVRQLAAATLPVEPAA